MLVFLNRNSYTFRNLSPGFFLLKFIYSEKATNFCKISTVDLSYVVTVKSMLEIWQMFLALSEYLNLIRMSNELIS